MLKQALISRINHYDALYETKRSRPDNERIALLKEYLNTQAITSLNDDDDIFFDDFLKYIKTKKKLDRTFLFSSSFWNAKHPASSLFVFNHFRNANNQHHSLFQEKIAGLDIRNLAAYLSPRDILRLGATSTAFFSATKSLDYWKAHLVEAGCDIDALNQLSLYGLYNYKHLYRAYTNIPRNHRLLVNQVWVLLCLSGDVTVIRNGINKNVIKKTCLDSSGSNALHYTALSGNPNAIDAVLKLEIPADSTNTEGTNALHFAAWSGNPNAIHAALKLGIPAKSANNIGSNILHYAAWSGNPNAIDAVLKLGIPADSTNTEGTNALHFAAWSENPKVIDTAVFKLMIPANSTDNNGRNALHYAVNSGKIKAIKAALELGISPDSIDHNGRNFMQYIKIQNPQQKQNLISAIEKLLAEKNEAPEQSSWDMGF